MRVLVLTIFLLAWLLTGCATYSSALISGRQYRLLFPHITLAPAHGERIESVEISVSCGRFRSLTVIPNDWSAEIVSPMSEKTTLRASAGHGSSTLSSIGVLNGAIAVSVEDASCFDITATVTTTSLQHRFTRSDLILKP
jgi:hypothetical protein